MRLSVDIIEDGGSRGGKARHGLKKGIRDIVDSAIHEEGQHPEKREQYPRQSHHEEGITNLQGAILVHLADAVEQQAYSTRQTCRQKEIMGIALPHHALIV